MEQDKLAFVTEVCARWSRGDLEGTLELIAADAVWEPSGRFIGSGQAYHGHPGVQKFWNLFREPWESISLEPVEGTELGDDRLLTRTLFRGTGRTSGVVTETELYVIWTVRDGLLSAYRSFADRALALEAAGISV